MHHPAEVPPGYPREFERELRLTDGRAIVIRPIIPEDGQQLAHAIRTADPETLYRRFLSARPRITPALLDHLCRVDYLERFALVAVDPLTGAGAGIARYEPVAAGTAEVAVAVDPAWRRVGLATILVELLAEAALDRGIHSFSAYYLAENRPVRALLDLAGGGRQIIRAGFADAAVPLDRVGVTAAVQHLGRG
jgi:RimJ/RimL family protein N-acetyltransferase